MNAKQAEELTGISRRNLRFYEQQGLISPSRNPGNDYRDYSEQDIEILKKIRALRMLDVSLEDIGAVLRSEKTLRQVMETQEQKLRQREQELRSAIRFCRELQTEEPDVDSLLTRMDQPETRRALFGGWIRDYQAVATAEQGKQFTFPAGRPVTTAREFTDALLAYGQREKKDIVITREGLEPEFTMDGISYRAERSFYYDDPQCPSDVVYCEALEQEKLEPNVDRKRSRLLAFVHHWWWALPLLLVEILYNWRTGMMPWLIALLTAIGLLWILGLDVLLYRKRSEKK